MSNNTGEQIRSEHSRIILESALAAVHKGWKVFPCQGKLPHGLLAPNGFHSSTDDESQVREWFDREHDLNYGIACAPSGLVVIDVDVRNGGTLAETLAHLEIRPDQYDSAFVVESGGAPMAGERGRHIYLRDVSPAVPYIGEIENLGIDVKHKGYVLGPGSVHPETGDRYSVVCDGQPHWPSDTTWNRINKGSNENSDKPKLYKLEPGEVKEGQRNKYLHSLGGKLTQLGLNEETMTAVLHAMNEAMEDPLERAEVESNAESAARYEHTTALEDAEVKFLPSEGLQEVRESCTDSGNADRFVNRYLDDVRYIHGLGWHVWDGKRWKLETSDDNSEMMTRARTVADSITSEARERVGASRAQAVKLLDWSVTSKSQVRLEAMLAVARSDRRISIHVDGLDADPVAINCANGLVDVRTGEITTRHKGDPVTKLIPHKYNPKAECPTWLEHLEAVFQGDKELIAYFQRCVGYSLTALTVEQCGFFLVGTGANGKSTTVDALRYAFGEYALATDPVILLAGAGGSGSKADALKADLVGIRFASMSENDAGTRLNQADFKKMMSGDPITAKRLYANPFRFNPVFTMWFDVNHLPTFDGTDDAMVRRIKVIPFNAKFKRGEKGTDGRRAEKLRAEAEGILAWAVRGAMEWFARGGTQGSIGTCAAVELATEDYATSNDPLADFIRWNYDTSDPNATTPVSDFQSALENHLQSEHLPLISVRELNKRLEEMGIVRKQQKETGWVRKVYRGIKPRPDDSLDPAF